MTHLFLITNPVYFEDIFPTNIVIGPKMFPGYFSMYLLHTTLLIRIKDCFDVDTYWPLGYQLISFGNQVCYENASVTQEMQVELANLNVLHQLFGLKNGVIVSFYKTNFLPHKLLN